MPCLGGSGSCIAAARARDLHLSLSWMRPQFVFTISTDSHPERPQMSHPTLYARSLYTAAQDGGDLHISIGEGRAAEEPSWSL